MTEPCPIFLMTDFGTEDPYVGLMKSVLVEKRPAPPVVDLTHEISPQDETNAAFLLEYVLPDLPTNAVLLLVVDPEVGTDREIIAVETTGDRIVLAPDTGILNGLEWRRAYYVKNDALSRVDVSSTFHGRDWFAPVGRFLSQGGNLDAVGPPVRKDPGATMVPEPVTDGNELRGEVVHVDHFGNLITNISRETLVDHLGDLTRTEFTIQTGNKSIDSFVETYSKAEGLTGVVGSFDRLEVAVPRGSAADTLNTGTGSTVVLKRHESRQEASA